MRRGFAENSARRCSAPGRGEERRETAPDAPLVDLVRALVDASDAQVGPDGGDLVLLGVPVAAHDLHRRVSRLEAGLGAGNLGHADEGVDERICRFARVVELGGLVAE